MQVFSGNATARQLKRADTLDLTQDVSVALNLQPAFQVKEGLIRKADAIFEKEQALVMESALQKPNKKPELYVNDHGYEAYSYRFHVVLIIIYQQIFDSDKANRWNSRGVSAFPVSAGLSRSESSRPNVIPFRIPHAGSPPYIVSFKRVRT